MAQLSIEVCTFKRSYFMEQTDKIATILSEHRTKGFGQLEGLARIGAALVITCIIGVGLTSLDIHDLVRIFLVLGVFAAAVNFLIGPPAEARRGMRKLIWFDGQTGDFVAITNCTDTPFLTMQKQGDFIFAIPTSRAIDGKIVYADGSTRHTYLNDVLGLCDAGINAVIVKNHGQEAFVTTKSLHQFLKKTVSDLRNNVPMSEIIGKMASA